MRQARLDQRKEDDGDDRKDGPGLELRAAESVTNRDGVEQHEGRRGSQQNDEVIPPVGAVTLDLLRRAGEHMQAEILLDELAPSQTIVRREDLITFVTDRPGHDLRYAIDPARICNELGWQPRETFDTGLRKTVAWYLANRSWWQPVRDGVYSGERLGVLA